MSFALAFVLVFGLGYSLSQCANVPTCSASEPHPRTHDDGPNGFAGHPADEVTVTISAIVLGLVVDDMTQFLYRFRHEIQHIHR